MKLFLYLLLSLGGLCAWGQELPFRATIDVRPAERACGDKVEALFENDKINFNTLTQGGAGKLRFTYFLTLDGFQLEPKMNDHVVEVVESAKALVSVKLRSLKPELPFAFVTIGVTVEDSSGQKVSDSKMFTVARNLVFIRDTDERGNCQETLAPEVFRQAIPNQNDTDLTISTTMAKQFIQEERKSKDYGWTFSPQLFFAGFGFALGSYHSSHLQAITKQTAEMTSIVATMTLSPGDYAVLYRQSTRYKQAYLVYSLDACGKKSFAGRAFFQRWISYYNVMKIDIMDPRKFEAKNVGLPAENTCGVLDQEASVRLNNGKL